MPFTVSAHRLLKDGASVPFRRSPNVGGTCRPRFLVMHFTAGGYDGAVSWLCNPAAKASAHLVVGEAGEVTQLVPFDRTAWHAGRSEWAGVTGLNPVSIGIELANYGELSGGPGRWTGPGGRAVPDARVKVARHANGGRETGWHTYSGRRSSPPPSTSPARCMRSIISRTWSGTTRSPRTARPTPARPSTCRPSAARSSAATATPP